MPGFASVASFPVAAPTTALTYSVVAEYGAFTLSGQDVTFTTAIVNSHGTFTVSGQDGAGAISLSGQDVLFIVELVCGYGTYTCSLHDVNRNFRDIYTGHFFPSAGERGFDDSLRAFADQHRRESEEKDVLALIALENSIIIKALKPFSEIPYAH